MLLRFVDLLTQQCRLTYTKHTGKNKEHDPHSAACFVQMRVVSFKRVYDGVFILNNSLSRTFRIFEQLVCSH